MTGTHVPVPRAPSDYTDVVELLDHADRAVDAVVTPVTAQEGLSREGWRILLLLAKGGGRSMGEIAEHASIPNPTATRLVDRLVVQGLAFRQTDPGDRRRILVHLAPSGKEAVERVSRQLERRVGSALAELTESGVELRVLLTRLADGLPTTSE
ncbi:MAG TPA: MarR family transcriptional regulator [Pseudonocardia sp.]